MFWSIVCTCLPLLKLLTVTTFANTRRGLRLNAFNQTRDRQTDRQTDRRTDRQTQRRDRDRETEFTECKFHHILLQEESDYYTH